MFGVVVGRDRRCIIAGCGCKFLDNNQTRKLAFHGLAYCSAAIALFRKIKDFYQNYAGDMLPKSMSLSNVKLQGQPSKAHAVKLLWLKTMLLFEYDFHDKRKRSTDSAIHQETWLIIRVKKRFSSKDDQRRRSSPRSFYQGCKWHEPGEEERGGQHNREEVFRGQWRRRWTLGSTEEEESPQALHDDLIVLRPVNVHSGRQENLELVSDELNQMKRTSQEEKPNSISDVSAWTSVRRRSRMVPYQKCMEYRRPVGQSIGLGCSWARASPDLLTTQVRLSSHMPMTKGMSQLKMSTRKWLQAAHTVCPECSFDKHEELSLF